MIKRAIQMVVRKAGLVLGAANGQQPITVGINTTAGES
jgi:hypothetical protein